ncbi:ATP-binding protein [Enhygromyxa salina]|uniref:Recombination protein F n=1 Tax=Enhygromyxa salina TaxID=215803 RepID=A0A2S9Y897_9BACT|nr:ATP-binding protein [Enhygromyxa salina]PRQ01327.1 recombination protein F [Enhygromyxa salina]
MSSKLTYLRVDKFRHVKPGSVVAFGGQINAVVGRNGAGKTTLLSLISALVRNNFHEFSRENFKLGFRLVDGEFAFEGTLSNEVKANDNSSKLELSGVLCRGDTSVYVDSNATESTVSHGGRQYRRKSIVPASEAKGGQFELIHAIRLALPGEVAELAALVHGKSGVAVDILSSPNHTCSRVREGVESFAELFAADKGNPDHAPTLGITLVTSPDTSGMWYSAGHHLADAVLMSQLETRSDIVDIITLDGAAPPLAQYIDLSQYTDARLILTKTVATIKDGVTRWVFANPLVRLTTASGNEIPHHYLSFGEKRLLAVLIKLYAYPSTIIVDELANGMHHSWIERILELIEDLGTQAFLTSQNPLLLDCLPLSRETFGTNHNLVICELTDSGEMIWRNLSETETEEFFKSLDVGLQHISEIMRNKGLW